MIVGIDTDFLVRLAVREHPGHASAGVTRDHRLSQGDRFALTPQVNCEFVHVVTDPRRFEKPFSMDQALEWASSWARSAEVHSISPNAETVKRFFEWMTRYRLGRKRILDTMLAATYVTAGLTHLITGNPDDYLIFDALHLIEI